MTQCLAASCIDKIKAAQERLNKANKDALTDQRKLEHIERARKALIKGLHDVAPTGTQEELENIEATTEFAGLTRERDALQKKIAAQKAKEAKDEADIQARINAPFKDLAPQETGVIASSLASIGGGGNVASFTNDPILAATIESNKILKEIQENTKPNVASPTIPEV